MSLFWQKYETKILPEPNSGCWLWMGTVNQWGYGRVAIGNGRMRVAHCIAYETDVGTIPRGLQLDHLCRVRCCCNPDHLEPVTPQVNVRRGEAGKRGFRKSNTHCIHGHDLSLTGVYVRPAGYRECLECKRISHQREHERKKAS